MNAIRIRKRLDSDTLHLPELKGMVGKVVEIIILEEPSPSAAATKDPGCFAALPPRETFDSKALEALRPNLTAEQFEALSAIATQDLIDVSAIAELRAASMI